MSQSRKDTRSDAAGRAPRVVVIGGGVIGLGTARELLRAGRDVTVVEKGEPAHGSTWAAGGMLAPLGEAPEAGPFQRAAVESLAAYPGFAESVARESGVDPLFRETGKLVLAVDDDGRERLRARAAWHAAEGFRSEVVDGNAARVLEPALSGQVEAALHIPTDSHIESRLLGKALRASVTALGGSIRAGTEVRALRSRGGRVTGVATAAGEEIPAECVVLAAGAWSGSLRGLPRPLPVRPVRGQMIVLETDAPLPRRLLAGPGAYVIPRGGTRSDQAVIGASQEEAGYDCETDEDTLTALHRAAAGLVPQLARARRIDAWAGLRPGTPDDLPILGADPELDGLVYATGHFRNGVLLTPYTARTLRDLIIDGTRAADLAAFRPDRFHGPPSEA